jgi:hypothetical protein
MDVSLLNAGLAAGTALAAAPVILHLFMRQTPRRVIFPALQLVRQRQKRSRKKMRIKNWLLLLARMALLALMAIALARPTLVSEASVGDQDVPAAIALVFDTSPSMGYTERDKTRLDEAKEFAYEVLARTPGSSLVYVIDSAVPGVQPLSPASARKRIEGLTLSTIARPLNAAVGQAYAAIADADRPLHQVIVLTDLARSAWDMERTVDGLDKKAKVKSGVKTFVLRLAPKDVHDVAVVAAEPTNEVVTEGEPLEVRARIRSLGPATSRVAELWLDGESRGKKPVDLPANGEADVRFSVAKVDAASRLHQGVVRISGAPDPLPVDDVRFFTFHVKPATRVLVVSDQAIDSQLIADAIDPDPATPSAGVARPYRVERIKTGAFLDHADNLSKRYRCIFVNNVAELSDVEWGKLSGFVADGGGLVVGLGPAVRLDRYQGATAAQVLPASLEKLSPGKETIRFAPATDYTHPLFQKYPRQLDADLTQTPIYRSWVVAPREGARVLLSYTDKTPALVERVFKGSKTGRVLLWTTPLSRRPESTSKDAWNDWPIAGWSYFYLMNQAVAYLAGTTEDVTDFEAGHDVVIPLDPTRRAKNYTVQGPNKSSNLLSAQGTSDSLVVVAPEQIGQWTVRPSPDDTTGDVIGFSVNVPVSETKFVALEESDLRSLFGGKDACVLAQNAEDLRIKVNIAKVGHELFPWVMLAILVVVTLENYLANRFYRVAAPRPATA